MRGIRKASAQTPKKNPPPERCPEAVGVRDCAMGIGAAYRAQGRTHGRQRVAQPQGIGAQTWAGGCRMKLCGPPSPWSWR